MQLSFCCKGQLQNPNFIVMLLPSMLSKIQQLSNLLSLFPPSIKTNHSSLPKESCRNKFSQDSSRKLCPEKRLPNDSNSPFKEKEKEGGEGRSQLDGLWKVPLFGGLRKVPLFGGLWKVPLFNGLWKFQCLVAFETFQCLVANGKKWRQILFTSSHFPPTNFT